MTTPDDLSAKRRAASLARTTKTGGRNGGRPPGSVSRKKRCPCGEMTAKRAKARAHKCL